MEIRLGGAWRSLPFADVYVGGQWKRVTRAEAYVGSAWKSAASFLPPLSASASPTDVGGFSAGSSVTTTATTVTPSGGTAPFTYLWTRVAGSYGTPTSASAATTAFSATVPVGTAEVSTFRCTVTDALGNVAIVDVGASFTNIDIPPF